MKQKFSILNQIIFYNNNKIQVRNFSKLIFSQNKKKFQKINKKCSHLIYKQNYLFQINKKINKNAKIKINLHLIIRQNNIFQIKKIKDKKIAQMIQQNNFKYKHKIMNNHNVILIFNRLIVNAEKDIFLHEMEMFLKFENN